MSNIDKQRIAAVRVLEALGYMFDDGWKAPAGAATSLVAEADDMHALLVLRADQIEGFTESSPEEAEFKAIADVLEAYEARRWPDGKALGGKGQEQ